MCLATAVAYVFYGRTNSLFSGIKLWQKARDMIVRNSSVGGRFLELVGKPLLLRSIKESMSSCASFLWRKTVLSSLLDLSVGNLKLFADLFIRDLK